MQAQGSIEALVRALGDVFPGLTFTLAHTPAVLEERSPEGGGAIVRADGGVVVATEPAPAVLVIVTPALWTLVATLPNPLDAGKTESVAWTASSEELGELFAKLGGFAAAVRAKLQKSGWDPAGAMAEALGRIV